MKLPTDLLPRPAVQVEPDDEPKIVRRGQNVNIQAGFAGTGMDPVNLSGKHSEVRYQARQETGRGVAAAVGHRQRHFWPPILFEHKPELEAGSQDCVHISEIGYEPNCSQSR